MDAAPTEQKQGPLPGRQFQMFLLFWHVVFLGGLAASLGYVWVEQHDVGILAKTTLTILVLAQALLYLFFFSWNIGAHMPLWKWIAYSAIGTAVWLAEISISRSFQWIVWAYIGQNMGALPPRASIPISLVLSAIYGFYILGWDYFRQITQTQALGIACVLSSFLVTGLFLHKVTNTSIERARLIADLEIARRKLEEARQQDAELAALRERERLARDLHDNLGHVLVTLSVQLEAVQRLYAQDRDRASSMIDEMKTLVRSSMSALRRSLANLRTAGLSGRPLVQALRDCCEETQKRAGIAVEFAALDNTPQFNAALSEALWHVARESLFNIEKHSGAKTAAVRLEWTRAWVTLRIVDDGCGLPGNAGNIPGHYGMRGMRERIEDLGGTFTASSIQPSGTSVEARAPNAGLADIGTNDAKIS